MIFKCVNCGGNVVYSPEKKKMFCPYCDSEDSQEIKYVKWGQLTVCPDCNGVIPVQEYTAATRCPYCDNYIVLDERVEGEFLPKQIIPFQLGKETVKQSMREKFKKKVFAPTDFLSEVRLETMEGNYVPFWFFDYDVNADYQGEGRKVRSWTSGNTEYTETSYYDVRRNLDIHFRDIPVDASIPMPDAVMDLMEPYDYKQLTGFDPKYLSGFVAERYNMPAADLEKRARTKMGDDTKELMQQQLTGYGSIKEIRNAAGVLREEQNYGLLPVWKYLYRYKGQDYPFYINGQTGKIVGEVPLSAAKVWAYAGTLWICLSIIFSTVLLVSLIFDLV